MWTHIPSECSPCSAESADWTLVSEPPALPPGLQSTWNETCIAPLSWRRVWRTVPSIRPLCGTVPSPSRQDAFTDALIASLADHRASPSPSPADAREQPTTGGCGASPSTSLPPSPLPWSSLRIPPTSSRKERKGSSPAYQTWVSALRQRSLQRRKLAHHTDGNASSLWASPRTSDQNGSGRHGDGGRDLRTQAEEWTTDFPWMTPTSRDYKDQACADADVPVNHLLGRQAVQWARQFEGVIGERWPTPDAGAINDGEATDSWRKRKKRLKRDYANGNGMGTPLAMAAAIWTETFTGLWRSPTAGTPNSNRGQGGQSAAKRKAQGHTVSLGDQTMDWIEAFRQLPETSRPGSPSLPAAPIFSPRLNPGFVLWLMGLPEGHLDL